MTRRSFVAAAVGAATVIPTLALPLAAAPESSATTPPKLAGTPLVATPAPGYFFFTAAEARFIEAACERLIPADESGPGALGAGVPHYLDAQLCGAWGAGERLYRSGPWQPGTPPRGSLESLTPAALFRTALRAIKHGFEARGTAFIELTADAQNAYLKSLEAGATDLDGIPSAVFFDLLLQMTVEGFFSNPIHGAGRDLVAWRMLGFPGAYADPKAGSRAAQ